MDALLPLLESLNETLTSAIVVVAMSLLLYNLTRDLSNRVARTSGIVLACVTLAYVIDVFISLEPDVSAFQTALRLQWVGLAFIPVAMLHLSDALLDTTGLPSRGRRRRIIRILYLFGGAFLVLAGFTDDLIQPTVINGNVSLQAQVIFPLYLIYFIITILVAFINVGRARQRCLTPSTKRRMTYLQMAFLTPALGIFPYSVLLNPGDEQSFIALFLVNLANVIVILMLLFLSYPLSFFGSDKPDRVVKTELLDFILRGPATGLIILTVINFTRPATAILGLSGEVFTPFAVVASVLLWQWAVALSLPLIEKYLIYRDEDSENISKFKDLSYRLLARGDILQLMEATLGEACDYLRVNRAFVASVDNGNSEIVRSIGSIDIPTVELQQANQQFNEASEATDRPTKSWNHYQIMPLYSDRMTEEEAPDTVIGILGFEAPPETFALDDEDAPMFFDLLNRIEQSLDDLRLREEVFNALEGLIPQIDTTQGRSDAGAYLPRRDSTKPVTEEHRNEYFEHVRGALRHYWGGTDLTQSQLLGLNLVQAQLDTEQADTPINALRNVLQEAIETLRPEGEQRMTSPEWTLYNILQLRFIEKRKVREVARRMSMSEADLYRKQRVAIQAVADSILEMERQPSI